MVDFKRELFANAYKKRIPLTVTIEIISQCNFRCVHCYIDDGRRIEMLSYEEIVDFGNQVIQMGCLYVILTGGEVLLHPDFERIYLFFVQKGVCVSVFTNGSLITSDSVELFVKYPPRVVEITMYGFSEDTYTRVTKQRVLDTVKSNILLLKQNGINVLMKMFVTTENYHDYCDISGFALQNNIPFKYDAMVIAPYDAEEMKHQISDNEVLELEQQRIWTDTKYNEETYQLIMGTRDRKMFLCGAGRSSCWLKSNGCLRFCNFIDNVEFDMKKHSVEEAWGLMAPYVETEISESSECGTCRYRSYCDYCPAKSYAVYEKADMEHHPDIYCKVAKMRACNQCNSK